MARNGFKILDSDTHIGPAVDVLEKYLTESEKRRLDSWEPYKWADPERCLSSTVKADEHTSKDPEMLELANRGGHELRLDRPEEFRKALLDLRNCRRGD